MISSSILTPWFLFLQPVYQLDLHLNIAVICSCSVGVGAERIDFDAQGGKEGNIEDVCIHGPRNSESGRSEPLDGGLGEVEEEPPFSAVLIARVR